jgi:hypothetical protein
VCLWTCSTLNSPPPPPPCPPPSPPTLTARCSLTLLTPTSLYLDAILWRMKKPLDDRTASLHCYRLNASIMHPFRH